MKDKDIDNLLDNLGDDYNIDIGSFLATLLQYSIRNGKYLEAVLRNQIALKEMLKGSPVEDKELIEEQLDQQLNDIQKDIEGEYYDVLSHIISKND